MMRGLCPRPLWAVILLASPEIALARTRGDGGGWVLFGIVAAVAGAWLFRSMVSKSVDSAMRGKAAEIEEKAQAERRITEQQREHALAQVAAKQAQLSAMEAAFRSSYVEGRRWLAQLIAEAYEAPERAQALALQTKKNPARKAADEVRRIAREKKELLQRAKFLEYALQTYHEYYPVLEQYSEDILNEQATLDLSDADDDTDLVTRYVSKEEYEHLSSSKRNQLALDNWRARPKSNVEIGRLYERYLGFLYEQDGWAVTYFGATQGLEDMGRDLICVRGSDLHVVQAKHWAKHRTVYEKHVFQLYGTTILLPHSRPDFAAKTITPVFATTTKLSDTALWAAKRLNVQLREEPMDFEYPMIKCNVNGGSKIYHLPFDQQYDRVRIDPSKGESYASTVVEAERRGFRRAMRHRAASS